MIEKALSNLDRWLLAYQRGTREAWCFEEWEEILGTRGVTELVAIITEDSNETISTIIVPWRLWASN